MSKKMSLLEAKAEKERLLQKIKDLESILSKMPQDTVLGVLWVKSQIKKTKKELGKIEKEIIFLMHS